MLKMRSVRYLWNESWTRVRKWQGGWHAATRQLSTVPEYSREAHPWVEYAPGSAHVMIKLSNNDVNFKSVSTSWLRHNCSKLIDSQTGQKLGSIALVAPPCLPTSVSLNEDELCIEWAADGHQSVFKRSWLEETLSSCNTVSSSAKNSSVSVPALKGLDYEYIIGSEKGTWEWLEILRFDGMCLVHGTPDRDGVVVDLANRISRPQWTMYGETFDVVVDSTPINVAYSTVELPLHMDLVYYESPPGLQFLHCRKFEPVVQGGESTLLDSKRLLENFRQNHPNHFDTLCRIPMRFQKIHYQRAEPVCFVYHRPIISVGPSGQIIQFTWAPPFEGPLPPQKNEDDTLAFYEAYCALSQAINESDERLEFRLQKNEVITFNNRRVMHGRNAFSTADGSIPPRHLQGVYVNIDDFKSRHLTLSMQFSSEPIAISNPHVWNQDVV